MPRIQGIALAGDVAQLAANGSMVQMDSNDFYQVILQRLQVASETQEWEEDFRALFQLDRQENGRSGPQILKIKLAIFQMKKSEKKDKKGNPQPATEHKINHRMAHPNILDLTQYQENAHLPLRYRLSSVISHSGEGTESAGGHYIASVRGPGGRITCISDSVTETFTQDQFEASPQVAGISPPAKEVYVLTYLRDDGRLQREMKNLESTLN
ncbi:uncharacterized protein J4E87_006646 [Alternaria ethzedia]|uniref:uncharacterized protein n=1 Tax=Alternaria ethzedia TaxID=181014 RepID=UPI0020C444FD|nr:uncharacterized protein J4E87_006646 [Alternaria ethzedia]KAI4621429.1 hypothetical protein J4E87_006646 [Alternaria ethzedia]